MERILEQALEVVKLYSSQTLGCSFCV